MDILDLLLFHSGGGGSPPEPTNPWIAGEETTLSQVGDKLRITAVNPGIINPRAYKLFTTADLTPGLTYTVISEAEAEGGHNSGSGFFRVSTSVGIPDGAVAQQAIAGTDIAVNMPFIMPASDVYIGYVILCNDPGNYADINYALVVNG